MLVDFLWWVLEMEVMFPQKRGHNCCFYNNSLPHWESFSAIFVLKCKLWPMLWNPHHVAPLKEIFSVSKHKALTYEQTKTTLWCISLFHGGEKLCWTDVTEERKGGAEDGWILLEEDHITTSLLLLFMQKIIEKRKKVDCVFFFLSSWGLFNVHVRASGAANQATQCSFCQR